jgi:hypothetical protein
MLRLSPNEAAKTFLETRWTCTEMHLVQQHLLRQTQERTRAPDLRDQP